MTTLEVPAVLRDDPVVSALHRLDPATRALLEMSVRLQLDPDEIASTLGLDRVELLAWLDDAVYHVASDAGVGAGNIHDVLATLGALPADAWRPGEHEVSESGEVAPYDRQADLAPVVAETVELPPASERARHVPWLPLALLALFAALVPARTVWAAQAVLLLLVLTVPGYLALRALRVPAITVRNYPLYIPAASLAVVMLSGLAVDLVGLWLGIADPLRPLPLLVGVEVVCLVLFVVAATARTPARPRFQLPALRLRGLLPLLLPVASAVGAARLNNGHSAAIAVASLCVAILALVWFAWRADRVSRLELSLALFGIGLAALWSFSLRSPFVYGFDIATESHTATITYANGVWHAAHPRDAYGAMLSLTILPSLLHALTGLPLLTLLKAVYPVLCALFPVALFGFATRFLRRQYAFIAAAFVVVQTYFFASLPALARQEIALLVFVALIAAALDRTLPRRAQWPLVALLAAGLVVSHYSTTYLAIAVLGVAVVLQLLVSLFRSVPRVTGAIVVACIALAGASAIWYGAVTESSSNVTSFSQNVQDRGLDLFPAQTRGQNLIETYLSGNAPTKIPAKRFGTLIRKEFVKEHPFVRPLPASHKPEYTLRDASVPVAKARAPAVSNVIKTGQVVVSQLANILAILGALGLVFARRTSHLSRYLGFLALATLLVLGFIRVSGTLASNYNQSRAFVQTMVVLGVAIAWALQTTAHRLPRLGRVVPALAALGLVTLFVSMSGIRTAVLGGDTSANLSNKGEDYERFYVTNPELAAARWLGIVAPRSAAVYTDRYGSLRVLAETDRSPFTTITPQVLHRTAWVYASRTNTVLGRARGSTVDDKWSVYQWPNRFLDDEFNTVYSNGFSKVYER